MLTLLTLNDDDMKPRMLRDAAVPLTRITLLCGPNGSGKSTLLDTFRAVVFDTSSRSGAPAVLIEGSHEGSVVFFSMEADNPRRQRNNSFDLRVISAQIDSQYVSHGQCNFDVLKGMFDEPRFTLLVLDEPENALDLDGLLWLREQLLTTTKQVILATHSAVLLSMAGQPDVSVQSFGPDANYGARVLDAYTKILQGKRVKAATKRLPKLAFAKKPAPRRTAASLTKKNPSSSRSNSIRLLSRD